MPQKYHPKLGLLPGFKKDPEKERHLAEERLERRAKLDAVLAKRRLVASGLVMSDLQKHVRNLTGGRIKRD